jgi:hypothetical protein
VTAGIVNAMRGEEDAFIKNVVFDSTKSFDELFTANYTFVNDTLAAYYGFPLPGTGATFTKVPIPSGSDRGGLLTLGMFLFGHARTNESSPTQRGHVIRANLYCQDIPPPPAGVNPVVMDGTPGKTAREQILSLTSTGICVNCHSLQDPIGFGLEGFGGDALQRAMDNGEAVDMSGTRRATKQRRVCRPTCTVTRVDSTRKHRSTRPAPRWMPARCKSSGRASSRATLTSRVSSFRSPFKIPLLHAVPRRS